MAGRLADQGRGQAATLGAILVLGLSFLASCWIAEGDAALILLAVLGVLIDAAVQTSQIVGQKVIYSVAAEERGRVNAVYKTCLFACAAVGSVLGTVSYHRGGWPLTGGVGAGIGGVLILLLAAERLSGDATRIGCRERARG